VEEWRSCRLLTRAESGLVDFCSARKRKIFLLEGAVVVVLTVTESLVCGLREKEILEIVTHEKVNMVSAMLAGQKTGIEIMILSSASIAGAEAVAVVEVEAMTVVMIIEDIKDEATVKMSRSG